jgi:hypothetical protein
MLANFKKCEAGQVMPIAKTLTIAPILKGRWLLGVSFAYLHAKPQAAKQTRGVSEGSSRDKSPFNQLWMWCCRADPRWRLGLVLAAQSEAAIEPDGPMPGVPLSFGGVRRKAAISSTVWHCFTLPFYLGRA